MTLQNTKNNKQKNSIQNGQVQNHEGTVFHIETSVSQVKSEDDTKTLKQILDEKADKSDLDEKADKSALDNKADKSDLDEKIDKSSIINNLTSGGIDKPLSAEQGKILEGKYEECLQNVSNGKSLVARAITDKGVETSENATFQQMATNIGNIKESSGGSYDDYTEVDVEFTKGKFLSSGGNAFIGSWSSDSSFRELDRHPSYSDEIPEGDHWRAGAGYFKIQGGIPEGHWCEIIFPKGAYFNIIIRKDSTDSNERGQVGFQKLIYHPHYRDIGTIAIKDSLHERNAVRTYYDKKKQSVYVELVSDGSFCWGISDICKVGYIIGSATMGTPPLTGFKARLRKI